MLLVCYFDDPKLHLVLFLYIAIIPLSSICVESKKAFFSWFLHADVIVFYATAGTQWAYMVLMQASICWWTADVIWATLSPWQQRSSVSWLSCASCCCSSAQRPVTYIHRPTQPWIHPRLLIRVQMCDPIWHMISVTSAASCKLLYSVLLSLFREC